MVKMPCFHCRGVWVWSLVRELRCWMLWGVAKKKDSTKKLESVKLKGLKSLHQNELLFYTPTLKHLKKEVSPIHNSIRAIKHMGTRKWKICKMKTTRFCWKKSKKIQTSGGTSCVHGLEESIIVKMYMLYNVIYRFSVIPIKISTAFFK